MEAIGIVFKSAPFLWLVFLGAAPLILRLTIREKARMAGYLVGAEILLAVLLILVAIVVGLLPGGDGIDWGTILWAILALLIAGVTGWLHIGAIYANLLAKYGG